MPPLRAEPPHASRPYATPMPGHPAFPRFRLLAATPSARCGPLQVAREETEAEEGFSSEQVQQQEDGSSRVGRAWSPVAHLAVETWIAFVGIHLTKMMNWRVGEQYSLKKLGSDPAQ